MNIADVTALVNQIQGWPVTVFVSSPGLSVIVLSHRIRYVQIDDGPFQVAQVFLVGKLRIVVANDDQTLAFVFVVPSPQRGNYVPAIDSTEGPHIDGNDFAAQIGQAQRRVYVQPDFVGQFRSGPEVR